MCIPSISQFNSNGYKNAGSYNSTDNATCSTDNVTSSTNNATCSTNNATSSTNNATSSTDNAASDSDKSGTTEQLLSNTSEVESAKTQAVEISDFSQNFDQDQNKQLDKTEISKLGDFSSTISNQINDEVHVGVSLDETGQLDAEMTSGDRTSVLPAYPSGTPVFSGHTHQSGNSEASDADIETRLDNGTNVVWDSTSQDFSFY